MFAKAVSANPSLMAASLLDDGYGCSVGQDGWTPRGSDILTLSSDGNTVTINPYDTHRCHNMLDDTTMLVIAMFFHSSVEHLVICSILERSAPA